MPVTRRLAAILTADVAGYSRLMGADEEGGRELGVRYVLEGSVRRTGEQVRVNGQLIDAEIISRTRTALVYLEFYETRSRSGDYWNSWSFGESSGMSAHLLLQSVLRTLAAVLGGFGVFYLIMSWSAPALCGLALVLIGAASAITYFVDR